MTSADSLRGATARGAKTMVGAQIIRFAVQALGLALLSRILSPEDFGRVAMVTAITGLAAVVGDFGLSLATIRVQEISKAQWSNLFWLNALVGVVTTLAVALCSGLVAAFFDDPSLKPLVIALSTVFLINGLAAQYRAELNRELRYGTLAVIESVGPVVGLVAAVGLGLSGFGSWALVSQQVIGALVALVLLLATLRFAPGWPTRAGDVRSFLRVGGATTFTQAVVYVSSNIDTVAIGRVWGASVLGVYSRAFQLFMLPLQQIAAPLTRVAVPALSRLRGTPKFYDYLGLAQMSLGYVLGITLAALAGLSEPTLAIVLGPQWSSGWIIVEILAVGGIFQALGYAYYWAFLTLGHMRVLLVCETIGRAVSVLLIILTVSRGTAFVAASYSVGLICVWAMTTFVGARQIGLHVRPLLRASARPTMIAAGIYVVGKTVRMALAGVTSNVFVVEAVGLAGMALLLVAVGLVSASVRSDVTSIMRSIRKS